MHLVHSHTIGVHLGARNTLAKLREWFLWFLWIPTSRPSVSSTPSADGCHPSHESSNQVLLLLPNAACMFLAH